MAGSSSRCASRLGAAWPPLLTASSTSACILSAAALFMTGPTFVVCSRGSPSLHWEASCSMSLENSSATLFTTSMALMASHLCPALLRLPWTHFVAANLRSASSRTMAIPFPPSSRCCLRTHAIEARCLPTSVLPVKVTPRTRGCDTKVSPISEPRPVRMLKTPWGRPAASNARPNSRRLIGVSLAALATTVLPARRAGTALATAANRG